MEPEPHRPIAGYYASPAEKQPFLRGLFDQAAPHYEGIAKWGWLGTGDAYRRQALRRAGLRPGMRLLDVASGTGPTARAALSILGEAGAITCLEPSAGMIAEAKKRLDCAYVQAGADAMPLPDAAYDFLSMGFALRHVEQLSTAFEEFFRVLKPGGTVFIMDETLPPRGLRRTLMKLYFKHLLPRMTRWFTRSRPAEQMMAYYWETLEHMAPPETVVAMLEAAGFIEVRHRLLAGMFSEYSATRPA